MKVLVTGGAGFVGGYLVEALLTAGFDVTVVDNFSSGSNDNLKEAQKISSTKSKRLEVIKRDIADADFWKSLGSFEAVYHFAAQSSVPRSTQDIASDFHSNVAPWALIIDWIRRNPPKLFVYSSSAGAAYGEALYHPTDERVVLKPLSPYGATKSFGDLYLPAISTSLKQKGELSSDPKNERYFTWTSLRLSNVYGPRRRPHHESSVIPIFVEKILSGEAPTIFGDGNKIRDYIYIHDVISVAMILLEKYQNAPIDEIFNVGRGEEVKDIRVFDAVMDSLEEFCRTNQNAALKARVAAIREPIFQAVRPGEVIHSSVSSEKAKAFMGWRSETAFDKGVFQTVKFYLEERLASDSI